jgi:hypothetical protein
MECRDAFIYCAFIDALWIKKIGKNNQMIVTSDARLVDSATAATLFFLSMA